MERIDNGIFFATQQQELQARKKTKHNEKSERKKFRAILETSVDAEHNVSGVGFSKNKSEHSLEELLEQAGRFGDVLAREQTMSSLKAYRSSVRLFLQAVMRRIEISSDVSSREVLNQKRFTLVEEIDQQLEKLVRHFMNAQQKPISILEAVDEITGLMVDLIH